MKQPHIQLDESLHISYALLPGDPGRLDRIAAQLEDVQELAYNREFRSLRGTYQGVPVLAISTGIGGSSAAIAAEELRNIGVKAMIRIGSCGALQKDIPLGTLIFASGAIRDEGTSRAYADIRFPAQTRKWTPTLKASNNAPMKKTFGATKTFGNKSKVV